METKQEKFDRLIDGRVDKAEQSLRVLGNLFNKSTYEWPEDKAEKIVDDLFTWVDKIREKAGVS
tara:strand:- start:14669 stop:14860 length:192 start_codon:yes stop_codon:yes gene_type:complete